MKFLVFSDMHADLFSDSEERLDKIIDSAKENKVDFIVSLGDVCHPVEENVKYLKKLQDSGLKVYHTIGNHDTEDSNIETALKFLGMEKGYYSFEAGEYKFIVIDDCYFRTEEGDEHFPNSQKKPCIYPVVPKEELEWLEKELKDNKKYIIFSHISLVRGFEARGIRNREEILALFKNREVLLCMNGHNHGTDLKIIDDTVFYTVNSATHFSWWEVSSEGVKIMDMPYVDPLHVIVELQDSTVRIKGMETYYRKEKPEDAGIVDNVWKGISTLPVAYSYNMEFGK
jgi:DNA repair exonuclease SbcCD nuclease subunit